MPSDAVYAHIEKLMSFRAFSITSGVSMSGCPIFRWYTFFPSFLACSAYGVSFLIGEAGISMPLFDISGITLYVYSFCKTNKKSRQLTAFYGIYIAS